MRQLPKRINGSSVSVVKAASVSMCACTHDMHKSVFLGTLRHGKKCVG